MEDWVLAYTAGIIDGEGCIGANRSVSQSRQVNPCYRIQVRVSNTNPKMILFLYNHFGGHIQRRATSHRTIYQWGVYGDNAILFLKLVAPFVCCKKDELQVVLNLSLEKREDMKLLLCNKLSALKKVSVDWEEFV